MPGTDLCIKIGGWVRAEAVYGGNGSLTWGPFNGNVNNRAHQQRSDAGPRLHHG